MEESDECLGGERLEVVLNEPQCTRASLFGRTQTVVILVESRAHFEKPVRSAEFIQCFNTSLHAERIAKCLLTAASCSQVECILKVRIAALQRVKRTIPVASGWFALLLTVAERRQEQNQANGDIHRDSRAVKRLKRA